MLKTLKNNQGLIRCLKADLHHLCFEMCSVPGSFSSLMANLAISIPSPTNQSFSSFFYLAFLRFSICFIWTDFFCWFSRINYGSHGSLVQETRKLGDKR